MSNFSLCIKAPAAMDQGTSWEEQAALPPWADEEGARQVGRTENNFPQRAHQEGLACVLNVLRLSQAMLQALGQVPG